MEIQLKRRHHYVWRGYLRPWANNEYIYCCFNEKEIKHLKLDKVAVEKDLYKLKRLTAKEIECIEKLIEKQSAFVQQYNKAWLRILTFVHQLKQSADEKGINEKELNDDYEEYICNAEEEMHTEIEDSGHKYIESILKENIDFYNDPESRSQFSNYICFQLTRTANTRNKIITEYKKTMTESYFEDINIENIWSILKIIFATNTAYSIFSVAAYKMILLKNESSKEFITGDQPVFNTYATGQPPQELVDLELYYPVSPKFAILITKKPRYHGITRISISKYEVIKYNQMVINHAGSQIYATSVEVLKECGLPKV